MVAKRRIESQKNPPCERRKRPFLDLHRDFD